MKNKIKYALLALLLLLPGFFTPKVQAFEPVTMMLLAPVALPAAGGGGNYAWCAVRFYGVRLQPHRQRRVGAVQAGAEYAGIAVLFLWCGYIEHLNLHPMGQTYGISSSYGGVRP